MLSCITLVAKLCFPFRWVCSLCSASHTGPLEEIIINCHFVGDRFLRQDANNRLCCLSFWEKVQRRITWDEIEADVQLMHILCEFTTWNLTLFSSHKWFSVHRSTCLGSPQHQLEAETDECRSRRRLHGASKILSNILNLHVILLCGNNAAAVRPLSKINRNK